jgi:hypothetical protein
MTHILNNLPPTWPPEAVAIVEQRALEIAYHSGVWPTTVDRSYCWESPDDSGEWIKVREISATMMGRLFEYVRLR